MIEESFSLNEVVINPKINPAIAIIKMQLPAEKKILKKQLASMPTFILGIFKLKNAPKKILGQKLEI
jgi:hypothetical protein